MKKLTPKQLAFITLVIKHPKKSHAVLYMKIYTNCKKIEAASACACRLLKKANVASYIAKRTEAALISVNKKEERAERGKKENNEISAERILLEFKRLCFVNAADFYDEDGKLIAVHKLERDLSAAIQEVKHNPDGTFSYKLFNKQSVLTDLGKASGLIKDVIELIITKKGQTEETNTAPVANSLDFKEITKKARVIDGECTVV